MNLKSCLKNVVGRYTNPEWATRYPLPYLIPVYHTVSDDYLPHVQHIIRYKNVKTFEQDLDQISKEVEWVDEAGFKRLLNGEKVTSKIPALLTFDDGLAEFYHIIVPILERKGIYAINFINPKFIDNKALMYRCKSSLLWDILKDKKSIHGGLAKAEDVRVKLFSVTFREQNILDQWAEENAISFKEFLEKQKPYMSLSELKELKQKGFGLASHGWDHPLYADLSLKEKLQNTALSVRFCDQHGFIKDFFAFPFTCHGVERKFFEEVAVEFGNNFYTFGAAGLKQDEVKNNLHRIPMEYGLSAEQTLRQEVGYYRIKALLGRHKIQR